MHIYIYTKICIYIYIERERDIDRCIAPKDAGREQHLGVAEIATRDPASADVVYGFAIQVLFTICMSIKSMYIQSRSGGVLFRRQSPCIIQPSFLARPGLGRRPLRLRDPGYLFATHYLYWDLTAISPAILSENNLTFRILSS